MISLLEIIPLSNFQIAETKTFEKVKKKIDPKIYKKMVDIVYPQLRRNPYYGSNIKKLKGELDGYYRYRLGSYRLFYMVHQEQVLVAIMDLKQRQSAYS